ncbi:ABC transporter permease [Intrasporangium chromatireducens Q5-1]|uniref:Autoinducer 2 import system permease protein LsrD n=1 Tax=Intrasporangium chromatireducens Q5-1 TaxID=584657 RepID=W9GPC1_9MICO|nr:ABC transporter permease [Intrasporangium chromatireducens]EWT05739.1 ABC transporter permease [Intrasporangium chromatireducens Q5-1]
MTDTTPATAPRSVPSPQGRRADRSRLVRDYGIVFSIAILVVLLSISTDTFLTAGNLRNLVDQMAVVGIVACGATLCIISGVFDLSSSAMLAVSAITGVFVTQSFGVGAGFLAAIVVGGVLGLVNGLVVTGIGVHSFIATLASSIVFRGVAVLLTGGSIVYPLTNQMDSFRVLNYQVNPGGLTLASWTFIAVLAVTWFLLSRTTFGRELYAVGGNAEAARLSGISVARVRILALVISGITASLAGLILASRGGSAQASLGSGLELTAIAATVVGGTSIMGGEGAIWRAGAGVLILQLFSNGFNLLGWDTTYQQVLTGALILIAVSVDQVLRRRRR